MKMNRQQKAVGGSLASPQELGYSVGVLFLRTLVSVPFGVVGNALEAIPARFSVVVAEVVVGGDERPRACGV